MYRELGGRIGYRMTPLRDLQECRLSIIAESNHQAKEDERLKKEQAEREAEAERIKKEAERMQGRR